MNGQNGKRNNRDGQNAVHRFVTGNQVRKSGRDDEKNWPQDTMNKAKG
jgi:hypothetical protein